MKLFLISCLIVTLSLSCNHLTPGTAAFTRRLQAGIKKDPKGAALKLIDDAKANARSTSAFLKEGIKKKQEEDVMERLKGCLQAYNLIGDDLDIDRAMLDTPDGRADVLETLGEWSPEISYDCTWQQLVHFPPIVKELNNKVNDFCDALDSASRIISSIK